MDARSISRANWAPLGSQKYGGFGKRAQGKTIGLCGYIYTQNKDVDTKLLEEGLFNATFSFSGDNLFVARDLEKGPAPRGFFLESVAHQHRRTALRPSALPLQLGPRGARIIVLKKINENNCWTGAVGCSPEISEIISSVWHYLCSWELGPDLAGRTRISSKTGKKGTKGAFYCWLKFLPTLSKRVHVQRC